MSVADSTLRISEIFFSLQGETSRTGLPTVFVRLTGCPLRCSYCDTEYAFTGGQTMTLTEIQQAVAQYPTRYICVTGGEPLAQKNCLSLLSLLCDAAYFVSLETSGALDVSAVDHRVMKVLDVKTPSSNESDRNLWQNFEYLNQQDEVKFVIGSQEDYQWSKDILQQYQLAERCGVLFSPVHGQLAPQLLADWVLQDGLSVRLQVQLHKVLWGMERAR